MRLIGGLVHWEPARASASDTALRTMAARVASGSTPCIVGDDGARLLAAELSEPPVRSGPYTVVADADLTNVDALLATTGPRGSVGEVLAALYERLGTDLPRALSGAFALAVWDHRAQSLFLAVDPLGIKRLYYVTDARRAAFASRPGALRAAPGVAGDVDPAGIYGYLCFGYLPAAQPMFAGITRLTPGATALIRDGRPAIASYWRPRWQTAPMRAGAAAAAVRDLVAGAVGRSLQGAIPKTTGAFLSGGTDSSTVVGLMTRLTGERANAFSIGFREGAYDELSYAEIAARHFDAAHYTRLVTAEDTMALLPRLAAAYDEPFANNSAIGTYFCAELARESGVTLLLAGDGGDEIFAGNERYRTDWVFGRYERVPAPLRRALEAGLASFPEGAPSLVQRARRYVRRARIPNPRRYYSWEFYFAGEGRALLDPDFVAAVDPEAPHRIVQDVYDRSAGASGLNRLLDLDLAFTIGDNDLLKVCRTAELAGVNVRFPMLDLPLVEFMGRVPAALKMRGAEKRHLFKRAFRPLLPPAVLAKRKHGFGVPTSLWLRAHAPFRALVRETLLSARARARGYLRPGAVEQLLAAHDADSTPYYGEFVWSLFMLELWHLHHQEAHAR